MEQASQVLKGDESSFKESNKGEIIEERRVLNTRVGQTRPG
jgi:hypothetical protein